MSTRAGGAARQSSGAAAGAAQGAAATSTSQSGIDDLLKAVGKRYDEDVGSAEALRALLAGQVGLDLLNGKLQVDNAMEACHSSIKNAQGHVKNVQSIEVQMLANLAANSDALMKAHLDAARLGNDRMWNLNETDQLATIVASILSNLGVKSDVGAAAIIEALGRILREAQKPA